MAKMVGAMHSDRVSGSYSGVTFREYRGLPVCSRKLRPVRRDAVKQSNNRSILGFLSRNYQKLTDLQKQSWIAWGVNHPQPDGFGNTFQLDGFQSYQKLMTTELRLFGYASIYTMAPLILPPATVDTVAAVAGVASGQIDVVWTVLGLGLNTDQIEIQCAGPFGSIAKVQVSSKYKFKANKQGHLLLATLSDLIPGAYYWVRVRYVDTYGQVTNWVADQCIAKA